MHGLICSNMVGCGPVQSPIVPYSPLWSPKLCVLVTRREGPMCLVSVWKVSNLCLEGIRKVSGGLMKGARKVSGRCSEVSLQGVH